MTTTSLQTWFYGQAGLSSETVGHGAGDAHDNQDQAQVDNQATIAPLVSPGKGDKAANDSFTCDALARAQRESRIVENRQHDEGEKCEAQKGKKILDLPNEQAKRDQQRSRRRPEKVSF